MLQLVDVGPRSLESYRGIAPDHFLDDLWAVAKDLKGLRFVPVNATPYGGGVSELLRSTVPILNDLGLIAAWKTISGDDRFFQVTKKIHNGLQGATENLSEADREAYLDTSQRNAQLFQEDYDFVFLHDPQPVAIPSMRGKGKFHMDIEHSFADLLTKEHSALRRGLIVLRTMTDRLELGIATDRHDVNALLIFFHYFGDVLHQ